ncbi:hypothetical protein [Xenorhabdus aichiensis]|nr:hypothetical protein [Xenorhabdus aichiensis]
MTLNASNEYRRPTRLPSSGDYAAVYSGTLLVASSAQIEKADLALCFKK